MVYADTKRMLYELSHITIPNDYESRFIQDLLARGTFNPSSLSMAQYNKVLEIYNKYVIVQAAVPKFKYDGTHRA